MRKVWLCIFYALCIFTIVFSLFWMALPSLPFPADSGEETPASEPGLAAQGSAGQSGTDFYLCDEGGRVVVYTCSDNGCPTSGSCAPASMSISCPRPMPSGSSRASTSPAKAALRALLEDLANKQKRVRPSPG